MSVTAVVHTKSKSKTGAHGRQIIEERLDEFKADRRSHVYNEFIQPFRNTIFSTDPVLAEAQKIRLRAWLEDTELNVFTALSSSIDRYIHALDAISKTALAWNGGLWAFLDRYPSSSEALIKLNWNSKLCRVIEKTKPRSDAWIAPVRAKQVTHRDWDEASKERHIKMIFGEGDVATRSGDTRKFEMVKPDCPRCGLQTKIDSTDALVRSSDEGTSVFWVCSSSECGHTWSKT